MGSRTRSNAQRPSVSVQYAKAWARARRLARAVSPSHALGLFILIAVTAATGMSLAVIDRRVAETKQQGAVAIGGPFRLEGTNGQTVTERSFPNRWTLMIFGYTYCPDVCPTTLATVGQALDALGPLAAQIQPLFVTVDPERDTRETMRDYLTHFDSRIIGLTGSPAAISEMAKTYRIYVASHRDTDGPDSYLVDHSAYIYLMSPKGAFVTHFSQAMPAAEMASALKTYL